MKIVIVEDHLMFREVLRKICADDLGHEVVAEASDGPGAIEAIARTTPGLILLDLHLPGLDGFSVVEAVRKQSKYIRVLVLSSHCDDYTVFRADELHVQGFVDKNTNSVDTLKKAIGTVANGGEWFSEAFQKHNHARRRSSEGFDKILTHRERAVLALVGLPMTDIEISKALNIAVDTVQKHRFNILRKLGIESTAELARYSRDHGFTLAARRGDDGALLP